jgi:hypothetical protein
MRPRGEIRQALRDAAPVLDEEARAAAVGVTYLDLACALAGKGVLSLEAPAEVRMVRNTVKNMAKAAELVRTGSARVPGCNRALGLYAVPTAADRERASVGASLQAVWGRAA